MIYENELLRMKILIYFHQNESSVCTVGKIADRLGSFKQKISKMLIALEDEGLVDRSDNRHPQLTKKGKLLADKYNTKLRMTADVLMQSGVSLEHVEQDAYNIVMGVSQSTIDAIKRSFMTNELKKELRGKGDFNGSVISEILYDGVYPMNFVIYRKEPNYEKQISMANAGFDHPGYIFLEKGKGKIKLRIKELTVPLSDDEGLIRGHGEEVSYLYNGEYVRAEIIGNTLTIPLEVVNFTSMGKDMNVQIQGSFFVKIKTSVDPLYMPVSEAIFTITI